MRILLDMDGVLADFVGGMCRAHGRENPYARPEARGTYQLNFWDMTPEEFWDKADFDFWANLDKLPEADALVNWAGGMVGFDNVGILSAPCKTRREECEAGKLRWVLEHLPKIALGNVIFEPEKAKHANPRTILIDDYDVHVRAFNLNGGVAYLWPADWNVAHAYDRALWVNKIKFDAAACVMHRRGRHGD
jgi:5'(3')-deoxyribonucleotidase